MKNQLSENLSNKRRMNSIVAFIILGFNGNGSFDDDPETYDDPVTYDDDPDSFDDEPETFCDEPDSFDNRLELNSYLHLLR
jgi:hypothetical protein